MNYLKSLVIISVVSAGVSCVSHPVVNLSLSPQKNSDVLSVLDKRPDTKRESELLSISATNCGYGIARLGDKNVVPDRISYLKARLIGEIESYVSGKTIEVNQFTIYRNYQVNLRGGLRGRGVLTDSIFSSFECFADITQEGGYNLEENPNGDNIAIVVISLTVDGKNISQRSIVMTLGLDSSTLTANDDWIITIRKAIDNAIDGIIEKI